MDKFESASSKCFKRGVKCEVEVSTRVGFQTVELVLNGDEYSYDKRAVGRIVGVCDQAKKVREGDAPEGAGEHGSNAGPNVGDSLLINLSFAAGDENISVAVALKGTVEAIRGDSELILHIDRHEIVRLNAFLNDVDVETALYYAQL